MCIPVCMLVLRRLPVLSMLVCLHGFLEVSGAAYLGLFLCVARGVLRRAEKPTGRTGEWLGVVLCGAGELVWSAAL